MAERPLAFDFIKPSDLTETDKVNCPWDEWFDGDIWKLVEGDDFQTHPLVMERIIRTRATTRVAKVRLRHQPADATVPFGVLVLERTDIPRPSGRFASGSSTTPLRDGRCELTLVTSTEGPCETSPTLAAGAPRCPACASWDVTRHVEGVRVWFTCQRCGVVFGP